ncbi:hypothetical protein ACIA8G_15370 [Lentzea sp. NPDC051213]|uniref:hypothetical protein n=1 Tax=Lentzea sp. NPDC051213 TaxID=3364126 RepID=UPI003799630C
MAAGLFTLAIMLGSFLIMAVGKAVIVVAFALMICWLGYVYTVLGYRPKTSKWELLPAMALGIITLFPANIGSHSLWLTAYGETLHCTVTSIETHVNRRSPNSYSNELRCGDRQVHYTPSMYRSAQKPGSEMDIVVDRTGFIPSLEPDKVALWRNLLLLLAVLMNAVFFFLVAWLPVREPEPAVEESR